ncbi:MAG: hypothetical protein E7D60_25375, partial [Bacillus sp. (in: firmicutes)]|nr:hypothetical protein [Bacillus sp. (in: firmicutes)]
WSLHYTRIWGGTPFLCSQNPWHVRAASYEINSCNKELFKELICSFKVWWTSIAGQLSLEWSVSDFSRQLYEDLVLYIKQHQIKPLQQLHISLLYDDCVFVKNNTTSYSAILPTKHFFINYRDVFTLLSITITQIKN